jgi:hypothetical protein
MTAKLSLRALWKIYKHTSVARGFAISKRELALSHVAFYSGARGVLRVSSRGGTRRLRLLPPGAVRLGLHVL